MRTRRRTYTAATPPSLLPEALPVSGTKRRKLQPCTAKAKANRGSKKKSKCITGLWDINLHSDLLQRILSLLGLKSNIQASAVCKAWYEAAVSVRKLKPRPLVFHSIGGLSPTGSTYIILADPLRSISRRYKVDFPMLNKDNAFSCSRDGWVLVKSIKHSRTLFLNPFTRKHFYLPKRTHNYFGNCVAFSAASTSTSCVVISCNQFFTSGDVVIDTWRPGESAWTTHRFEHCEPPHSWSKCVFSNGVFYCLSTCGHLGVFDPREATWNLLPVKPCPAFLQECILFRWPVHLTEHEGDIFVIYTHRDNSNPTVFKLNLKQNVWEEKRDLGGLTVFTSVSGSFIRSGLSPEVRNRIYPSLPATNGKYYSLGDGRSSDPPLNPCLSSRVAWVEAND